MRFGPLRQLLDMSPYLYGRFSTRFQLCKNRTRSNSVGERSRTDSWPGSRFRVGETASGRSSAQVSGPVIKASSWIDANKPSTDVEPLPLHHVLRLTLAGALCRTKLENPGKILDIGTGTGIWPIEG